MCEFLGAKPGKRNESIKVGTCKKAHHRPVLKFTDRSEQEHICQDPKDGELCVSRVKPEETLVEARRDSDVQIDLKTCVQGRKTNRTI